MLDDELKFILCNVKEWLKFAEEKNAALIGLNGAILFATLSLVSRNLDNISFAGDCTTDEKIILFYLLNFILFISAGLLISLISFLPQSNNNVSNSIYGSEKEDNNPLYFSHIGNYSETSYLKKIYNSHDKKKYAYCKYELDYANQIIAISRIGVLKYLNFRVALWFTVCAIVTPLFGYLLFVILDAQNAKIKISLLLEYIFVFCISYVVIY